MQRRDATMLYVAPHIVIPDSELELSFARSGGPGGQNVNKVSSKVLLRWRPAASNAMAPELKNRLLEMLRGRLTKEGDVLVVSQKHRDQPRNIQDCYEKLRALILTGIRRPTPRRPTKPTRGAKERRHQQKRRRSQTKAARRMLRED